MLSKSVQQDLWQTQIVMLGSVHGINTRYRPALHALYGKVVIREIHGATECVFSQQRDEKKAWVPNYDLFFFGVETRPSAGLRTGSRIRMLHQMQAARTQLGRDGQHDRLHASAGTLQDRRPDSSFPATILPLRWA